MRTAAIDAFSISGNGKLLFYIYITVYIAVLPALVSLCPALEKCFSEEVQ